MKSINRATLGGFLTIFAVIFALLAASSQEAKEQEIAHTEQPTASAQRMAMLQQQADEEAAAVLKAYEQEDFDFMQGVVLEPIDD